MGSAQSDLLAQVSTTMLSKGLKGEQEQSTDLLKTLAPLPEGSGAKVDLFA